MITYAGAMETVRQYQAGPPVETIPIAHALGLEVYRVDNWPNNVSGMIERDADEGGESGFAIYVNSGHPLVRRRFTIAHEIAHFMLHKEQIGDGVRDDALYRSGLSNRMEAEANRFAADILMPWHLLTQEIGRDHDTIPKLADIFHVSNSAMSIRIGVPYETA